MTRRPRGESRPAAARSRPEPAQEWPTPTGHTAGMAHVHQHVRRQRLTDVEPMQPRLTPTQQPHRRSMIDIDRSRDDHDERDRINPTPRWTRGGGHLSRRHRRLYSASMTGVGCSWPSSRRVGHPGRRGHSDLPGGGGGGGRPLPVQQMITMVMTVLASSPDRRVPRRRPDTDAAWGPLTPPHAHQGASPDRIHRGGHHRCAQSVSGSAGWCGSSMLPVAAPLALRNTHSVSSAIPRCRLL